MGRTIPRQLVYLYLFVLAAEQIIQYYLPARMSRSIDEERVIWKVCPNDYSRKGTCLKVLNNNGGGGILVACDNILL